MLAVQISSITKDLEKVKRQLKEEKAKRVKKEKERKRTNISQIAAKAATKTIVKKRKNEKIAAGKQKYDDGTPMWLGMKMHQEKDGRFSHVKAPLYHWHFCIARAKSHGANLGLTKADMGGNNNRNSWLYQTSKEFQKQDLDEAEHERKMQRLLAQNMDLKTQIAAVTQAQAHQAAAPAAKKTSSKKTSSSDGSSSDGSSSSTETSSTETTTSSSDTEW
ncbi:hypothetical protein N9L68_07110 [bacterium]|nr:hypothetical protein [bacterium]